MDLAAEREACARLTRELAIGRPLAVQLFAAELAGKILARSVPVTEERLSIAETAKLLGICRGRLAQLVGERVIPTPDDAGTFPKGEITALSLWLGARLKLDQFARIEALREKQRAGT